MRRPGRKEAPGEEPAESARRKRSARLVIGEDTGNQRRWLIGSHRSAVLGAIDQRRH